MKRKSLTLLEVLIVMLITALCVAALLPLTQYYVKMKGKSSTVAPALETAAVLETAFQSLMRAVNISDEAVVSIPDQSSMIWKTQSGKYNRLNFDSAAGKLYYDNEYDPDSQQASETQMTILAGVAQVGFSVDDMGRVIVELEKKYTSGDDNEQTLAMRTAIRPYLVRSQNKGKKDYWIDVSPALEGIVERIEEKNGQLYAVVQDGSIAMHSTNRFDPIGEETFYVLIPEGLEQRVEEHIGTTVMFNGDILPHKEGWYMTINPFYGGGVIFSEEDRAQARARIEEGREEWYQNASRYLDGCFAMAREQNIDVNDWKALWTWMRFYYHEYLASFRDKGVN